MKKIVLALSAVALLGVGAYASDAKHEAAHEVHWDYDKHGPDHWGEFGQECSIGKAQSPIDIIASSTVKLVPASEISINENMQAKYKIIDNGHAIQAMIENGGSITRDGVEYKLVQFHYHGKSEEKINGKQYDLVAHMVHKSDFGSLLVVGLLYEEGKTKNENLEKIIKGVNTSGKLNPSGYYPKDISHYYHYQGSLTTPPCSQGVQWYVMKEVQSATKGQIEAMRKYYAKNYRPVQPLNGRVVESK